MSGLKETYRIFRSVLFSVILIVVGLYLIVYLLLSIPAFQNIIRDAAVRELSAYLGSKVDIEKVDIYPFNQIVLTGVSIEDKSGNKCLSVQKLGTGIHVGKLLFRREIIFTYAEIIGLNVHITKERQSSPLNIQFIIDAFKSKDKNRSPAKFRFQLHSIVLRRCGVTFDKLWIKRKFSDRFDPSHITVSDIKADLSLPLIKNDEFLVDLRRLSLKEKSGINLESITLTAHITDAGADIKNIDIVLPGTSLAPSDIKISYNGFNDLADALKRENYHLYIQHDKITLSDFKAFLPCLSSFDAPFYVSLDADGNMEKIRLRNFDIVSGNKDDLNMHLSGSADDVMSKNQRSIILETLELRVSEAFIGKITSNLSKLSDRLRTIISKSGDVEIEGSGKYIVDKFDFLGFVHTAPGKLSIDVEVDMANGHRNFKGGVRSDGFNLHHMLGNVGLGETSFQLEGDVTIAGKNISGKADALIHYLDYNGYRLNDIAVGASGSGNEFGVSLNINDKIASVRASLDGIYENTIDRLRANIDVGHFIPSEIGLLKTARDYVFSGNIDADIHGGSLDAINGFLNLNSFKVTAPGKAPLILSCLNISNFSSGDENHIILQSDWLNGDIKGHFRPMDVPKVVMTLVGEAIPAIKPLLHGDNNYDNTRNFGFIFTVENNNEWTEFFNLPFRMLMPIPIEGSFDALSKTGYVTVDVPYLQQGKDKLIRNTRLEAKLDGNKISSGLFATTTLPGKNGDIKLNIEAKVTDNNLLTDIFWKFDRKERFDGKVELFTTLKEFVSGTEPEFNVRINPSTFYVADVPWSIGDGAVGYKNKKLKIDDLRIWHNNQFVNIDGVASGSNADTLNISFADFNLDYLFETLRINYVTFGGDATGLVKATSCFSSHPMAFTESLVVKNLSYNSAVLGDYALLRSAWNNQEKEVEIGAEIFETGKHVASVNGGVFVTRDSLSFDIDADKVDIKFLKPFVQAFTSDVEGRATGGVKLFGTFSDIDLIGKVYADTISMKLDYTNVTYSGKDTVYMTPGRITIPAFRLHDKYGNSGIMSGVVIHRYFHEPRFEFKLINARKLLAYDTNAAINPDWYGTVFVNGNASVKGVPGLVNILIDVSTAAGSTFTYVLNDIEAAEEYKFLSFTDKKKEKQLAAKRDTVPDFVKEFRKKIEGQQGAPSQFGIDIRASVTPQTKINIIMDPRVGDKITGRGEGSLQISYNSDVDNMSMYGKYAIEEGKYNFTLQDLIIKDFTIKRGSSISFNGNPLMAGLDISAIYRVNTNLSDLDKSFSQDKDLNRTNVPVDAILKVNGELQNPDISFDIELPTLTQDVKRKVKSIISTDDMLNRQIIYLLALNRFYTPEYMSGQSGSGGGELASVASSTISSQISSMLGQLSDKWSLAPSFRSDKGDFSDTEFDLALSSRLLNNRLLINGNFGYRDRTTSTTTFVGDFDIEYLLSRSGNLRLKAYNHFNDQNYYLKSALTTQGLGIIYRRDFDNPFTFLRRKKKKDEEKKKTESVMDIDNK